MTIEDGGGGEVGGGGMFLTFKIMADKLIVTGIVAPGRPRLFLFLGIVYNNEATYYMWTAFPWNYTQVCCLSENEQQLPYTQQWPH